MIYQNICGDSVAWFLLTAIAASTQSKLRTLTSLSSSLGRACPIGEQFSVALPTDPACHDEQVSYKNPHGVFTKSAIFQILPPSKLSLSINHRCGDRLVDAVGVLDNGDVFALQSTL
jgi:hypothetical protein